MEFKPAMKERRDASRALKENRLFLPNKRKDVCAMKVMVERILLWFGGAMAVLARYTATASVSSTCFYTAYQPDVPDEL